MPQISGRKKTPNRLVHYKTWVVLSTAEFCALIMDSWSVSFLQRSTFDSKQHQLVSKCFGLLWQHATCISLSFWDLQFSSFFSFLRLLGKVLWVCRLTQISSAEEVKRVVCVSGMRCRPKKKWIQNGWHVGGVRKSNKKCVNHDGCWFRLVWRTNFSACYYMSTWYPAWLVVLTVSRPNTQPEAEGTWGQWENLSVRLTQYHMSYLVKFWSRFDITEYWFVHQSQNQEKSVSNLVFALCITITVSVTESGKKSFQIQCLIIYAHKHTRTNTYACWQMPWYTYAHTHSSLNELNWHGNRLGNLGYLKICRDTSLCLVTSLKS